MLEVMQTGGLYMIEVHKAGCSDLGKPKYGFGMVNWMGQVESVEAFWEQYEDKGDEYDPGYVDGCLLYTSPSPRD